MVEIGQFIGNYKIVRKIGAGGMGSVFEAVHQQIGSHAAIKVLLPTHTENQDMRTRFFNEARAVNIVQHPGIVRIFECGSLPDGSAFIVMEYLEGETLRARLRKAGGRLDGQSLLLARQIASALAAAHAKGIIHRDLKPDNFMLVADSEMATGERIKILDFGIAKLAAEGGEGEERGEGDGEVVRTRTGVILGTPAYMSPEQCRGLGKVDEKTDVYALGVILYEMLSGKPPFKSPGFGEIAAMHMFMPVPALRERVPGIRPEVAELVHQMLEKSSVDRPSMSEVAKRLDDLYFNRKRESHPSLMAAVAHGSPFGMGSGPTALEARQGGHTGAPVLSVKITDTGSAPTGSLAGVPIAATDIESARSTLTQATGQSAQLAPISPASDAPAMAASLASAKRPIPRLLVLAGGGGLLLVMGLVSVWRLLDGNEARPHAPNAGHVSGVPVPVAESVKPQPSVIGVGSKPDEGKPSVSAGSGGPVAELLRVAKEKLASGDKDGSLRLAQQAVELEPQNREAQLVLASAAHAKKDATLEVKSLRDAQKLKSLSSAESARLARAYDDLGKPQEALEVVNKALKRSPGSAELLMLHSQISGKIDASATKPVHKHIDD